jgi:curved DNA-binding protein CbpA
MSDPYEVFGIDKNSNQDIIKQRYRILVQKWHPDKFTNASEDEKKESLLMFEQIQAANSILGDPDRRKLYDDTGFIEPSENELSRSVESTLKLLVTGFLAQGDAIFTINIINEINKYCNNSIRSAKNRISQLKKKRLFLSKVVKKFKRRKKLSRDFLNNIFLNEFNALDQSINGQLTVVLIMTQVKSVINSYEFDFMNVIEGPTNLQSPKNRVPLGNIFELAGVNNTNGR